MSTSWKSFRNLMKFFHHTRYDRRSWCSHKISAGGTAERILLYFWYEWNVHDCCRQLSRPASSDMHAELLRKYRSSNPIGDVIVSTLRDRSFFMQWHTSMLREKEDSDIYYTSEFLLLKVHFQSFGRLHWINRWCVGYCIWIVASFWEQNHIIRPPGYAIWMLAAEDCKT